MSLRWLQTVARLVALIAALLVSADEADARLAGELSGAAPAPLVRASLIAADGTTRRTVLAQMPAGGSLSDFFRRGGLLGGFAAGFLGCGLLGLLFGRSLLGDLGGVSSYLGLLFQLALIVMLGRLIWNRWHHVGFAGVVGLSPRQLADPYLRSRDDPHTGFDSAAEAEDRNAASPNERSSKIKETQSPPRE